MFRGYFGAYNWLALVLILPGEICLLRWMLGVIGPVVSPDLPKPPPPVIGLLKGALGRERAYQEMRAVLLSRWNLWIALAVALMFNIIDTWETLASYRALLAGDELGAYDAAFADGGWSNMFVASEDMGPWQNLILIVAAYTVQFLMLVLVGLLIVLVVRHHLFFIRRIYQRRNVPIDRVSEYIVIDLDDFKRNRCFGLIDAHRALNKPVIMLSIATILMLVSRYSNTAHNDTAYYEILDTIRARDFQSIPEFSELLFPDIGQVMMLILWTIGAFVALSPAVIKVLPWFSIWKPNGHKFDLEWYIREFLPDHYLPFRTNDKERPVRKVAAKFALNAFWPTGNQRAIFLFFAAFATAYIMVFPVIPKMNFSFLVYVGIGVILAIFCTLLIFLILRTPLHYVDKVLVKSNGEAKLMANAAPDQPRIACSVFICYRRFGKDGEAAELVERYFETLIAPDGIFRDKRSIQPGDEYPAEITKALEEKDVLLVLIGKGWVKELHERAKNPHEFDYVRYEIRTALEARKHIIPLLIDGTPSPKEESLPEDLAPLATTLQMWSISTDDLANRAVVNEEALGRLTTKLESIDPGSLRNQVD